VAMTAKTVKDAIAVPAAGVFKTPEGADYVLVAGSDGHAHVKLVQVGIRSGEFAQIVSGISAGEAVITSGGYALPDNTQIKIEAPAAPEKTAGEKNDKAGDVATPAKSSNKAKE